MSSSSDEFTSSDEDEAMELSEPVPDSLEVMTSPLKSPCPEPNKSTLEQQPVVPAIPVKHVPKIACTFKYISPLNRSRSRSPNLDVGHNSEKRGDGQARAYHLKPRREYGHRDRYRARRNRPYPKPDRSPDSYSKHTMPANVRLGKQHARRSCDKLRMPAHLRRRSGENPVALRSIPAIATSNKVFVVPPPPEVQPERFTDAMVNKLIERAASNQDLTNKTVTESRLDVKFAAMQAFFRKSVNRDWWVSTRKETMACSGANILCMFLDETLTWAKLCHKNRVDIQNSGNDIILNTASFLASQLCFKVKQTLPCFLFEPYQQALARQLCYLVCSGHRFFDAGSLLEEVIVDSDVNLVLALAITVPMLMLPLQEGTPPPKLFLKYLEMYQPGMVSALFDRALQTHSARCKSRFCASSVRAMVGPTGLTKGLFFAPTSVP